MLCTFLVKMDASFFHHYCCCYCNQSCFPSFFFVFVYLFGALCWHDMAFFLLSIRHTTTRRCFFLFFLHSGIALHSYNQGPASACIESGRRRGKFQSVDRQPKLCNVVKEKCWIRASPPYIDSHYYSYSFLSSFWYQREQKTTRPTKAKMEEKGDRKDGSSSYHRSGVCRGKRGAAQKRRRLPLILLLWQSDDT